MRSSSDKLTPGTLLGVSILILSLILDPGSRRRCHSLPEPSAWPLPDRHNWPDAPDRLLTNTPTRSNKPSKTPNSPDPPAKNCSAKTNASPRRTANSGRLWRTASTGFRERQQRFFVTAAACGVSLSTTQVLLELLLGRRTPSQGHPGLRWVADAGQLAPDAVLTRPRRCALASLVTTVCLDEICCHHRPILVGVEPRSFSLVLARRAEDCTGETWAQTLAPWNHVRTRPWSTAAWAYRRG